MSRFFSLATSFFAAKWTTNGPENAHLSARKSEKSSLFCSSIRKEKTNPMFAELGKSPYDEATDMVWSAGGNACQWPLIAVFAKNRQPKVPTSGAAFYFRSCGQ
jgi:hypothetical protein